jgi:hypothetical protein
MLEAQSHWSQLLRAEELITIGHEPSIAPALLARELWKAFAHTFKGANNFRAYKGRPLVGLYPGLLNEPHKRRLSSSCKRKRN